MDAWIQESQEQNRQIFSKIQRLRQEIQLVQNDNKFFLSQLEPYEDWMDEAYRYIMKYQNSESDSEYEEEESVSEDEKEDNFYDDSQLPDDLDDEQEDGDFYEELFAENEKKLKNRKHDKQKKSGDQKLPATPIPPNFLQAQQAFAMQQQIPFGPQFQNLLSTNQLQQSINKNQGNISIIPIQLNQLQPVSQIQTIQNQVTPNSNIYPPIQIPSAQILSSPQASQVNPKQISQFPIIQNQSKLNLSVSNIQTPNSNSPSQTAQLNYSQTPLQPAKTSLTTIPNQFTQNINQPVLIQTNTMILTPKSESTLPIESDSIQLQKPENISANAPITPTKPTIIPQSNIHEKAMQKEAVRSETENQSLDLLFKPSSNKKLETSKPVLLTSNSGQTSPIKMSEKVNEQPPQFISTPNSIKKPVYNQPLAQSPPKKSPLFQPPTSMNEQKSQTQINSLQTNNIQSSNNAGIFRNPANSVSLLQQVSAYNVQKDQSNELSKPQPALNKYSLQAPIPLSNMPKQASQNQNEVKPQPNKIIQEGPPQKKEASPNKNPIRTNTTADKTSQSQTVPIMNQVGRILEQLRQQSQSSHQSISEKKMNIKNEKLSVSTPINLTKLNVQQQTPFEKSITIHKSSQRQGMQDNLLPSHFNQTILDNSPKPSENNQPQKQIEQKENNLAQSPIKQNYNTATEAGQQNQPIVEANKKTTSKNIPYQHSSRMNALLERLKVLTNTENKSTITKPTNPSNNISTQTTSPTQNQQNEAILNSKPTFGQNPIQSYKSPIIVEQSNSNISLPISSRIEQNKPMNVATPNSMSQRVIQNSQIQKPLGIFQAEMNQKMQSQAQPNQMYQPQNLQTSQPDSIQLNQKQQINSSHISKFAFSPQSKLQIPNQVPTFLKPPPLSVLNLNPQNQFRNQQNHNSQNQKNMILQNEQQDPQLIDCLIDAISQVQANNILQNQIQQANENQNIPHDQIKKKAPTPFPKDADLIAYANIILQKGQYKD